MTDIPDDVLDEIERADLAKIARVVLAKLRAAWKAETPVAGDDLDDSFLTPVFLDKESVRGLWRQADKLCHLFNRLIEVLGEPPADVMPDTVNDWIVGQVRELKDSAMSAETTRKNALSAMNARKAAEQIMRDNCRRAGDDKMAVAHADRAQAFYEAAAAIKALPLTAPKEG